ncbi:hypothetical protein GEMRC1_010678 [Eukaryota sp. GEM-RC1]
MSPSELYIQVNEAVQRVDTTGSVGHLGSNADIIPLVVQFLPESGFESLQSLLSVHPDLSIELLRPVSFKALNDASSQRSTQFSGHLRRIIDQSLFVLNSLDPTKSMVMPYSSDAEATVISLARNHIVLSDLNGQHLVHRVHPPCGATLL